METAWMIANGQEFGSDTNYHHTTSIFITPQPGHFREGSFEQKAVISSYFYSLYFLLNLELKYRYGEPYMTSIF